MSREISEEIINHPDFVRILKEKRKVQFGLLGLVLVLFLAIPIITGLVPWLFKIHLFGGVNVGFLYIILQYAVGGGVAVFYSKKFGRLDLETKELMAKFVSHKALEK